MQPKLQAFAGWTLDAAMNRVSLMESGVYLQEESIERSNASAAERAWLLNERVA
jgi:hypothetical protein